jgi:hypothetical protein
MLELQPMGFYMPAVLVKDAQRHGLRVKPIDVQVSEWACTTEREMDGSWSLRLGLGYAKGLRKQSAEAIARSCQVGGSFRSAEDLVARVPSLNRKELTLLNATPYTVLGPDDHLPDTVAILARDCEGLIDLFDLSGVCKQRCKPLGVCVE